MKVFNLPVSVVVIVGIIIIANASWHCAGV